MKAAIYEGKQAVSIREVPTPVCGDNDVLLQNLYASICGTDVAVYTHGPGTGHKITVGGEFGHEVVSRVAAVGKNVKDFRVGDRVYPYPLLVTGDTGRAGTIGGFSEYIILKSVRDADGEEELVEIEDDAEFDRVAATFDDAFDAEYDYDAE